MTIGSKHVIKGELVQLNCNLCWVGFESIKTWAGDDSPDRTARNKYNMTYTEKTIGVVEYALKSQPNTWRTCTVDSLNNGNQPTPYTTWGPNDDLALISKLRTKLVGSSFNLGIFLGEGRQTLDMIAGAATRIYGSWRAFKKGNLSKALDIATGVDRNFNRQKKLDHVSLVYGQRRNPLGKLPRKWANNHLELMYGWVPLLSDVKDGAEALSHQLEAPKTFRVQVHLKRDGRIQDPVRMKSTGKSYRSKNLIAFLTEDGVNIPKLVGLTDPAQVAWEVVPFSFVADWFLPVGSYLEARGVANSLIGEFVTSTKDVFDVVSWPNLDYYASFRGEPCSFKRVSFSRQITSSLSVPLPEVVPLGSVLNWQRASNAVALITQRLGKS